MPFSPCMYMYCYLLVWNLSCSRCRHRFHSCNRLTRFNFPWWKVLSTCLCKNNIAFVIKYGWMSKEKKSNRGKFLDHKHKLVWLIHVWYQFLVKSFCSILLYFSVMSKEKIKKKSTQIHFSQTDLSDFLFALSQQEIGNFDGDVSWIDPVLGQGPVYNGLYHLPLWGLTD